MMEWRPQRKYIEVGVDMTKCDFCAKSSPSGQCYWSSQVLREKDCKRAIEQMVKVLGKKYK